MASPTSREHEVFNMENLVNVELYKPIINKVAIIDVGKSVYFALLSPHYVRCGTSRMPSPTRDKPQFEKTGHRGRRPLQEINRSLKKRDVEDAVPYER